MAKDITRAIATTKQQNESDEEIAAFLGKHKINYDYSFDMVDSLWRALSTDTLGLELNKIEAGQSASPMQVRVYDQNGDFLTGHAQCFGDFKKLNILDSYPPRIIERLPINRDLKFHYELFMMNTTTQTKSILLVETPEFDYTIVVYWNIWSNYYSKVILEAASDYTIHQNEAGHHIRLILINSAIDKIRNTM